MADGKLRIAVFSDSALPILNGVSVSIDTLVQALRRAGHSVHVYTAGAPLYRDPDPNTFRFWAVETPWSRGYPLAVPPFYRMLYEFRKHTYDIIHTHTPFTIGFVGLRWAESHDIPIVATYHTLYDRYAHYVPYFPRRYVRFKIAKHTHFYYSSVLEVIVPSDAARRWLQRHAVKTPITVIPTGTPEPRILDRAEVRVQLGLAPGERMMLYVGRVAKEKNLGPLFEMAAKVMAERPETRLWLVGDGPFRGEAMAMVRALGIGDKVRFVGAVPRYEVDHYYCAADVFVFSSLTETQGLVLQEAMTYGLPAVAYVGGGASETIQDGINGFGVRNDVSDFAERVLQVLGDDALHARLSRGAKESVRERSSSAMARSVVDVYHRAIGKYIPEEVGGARLSWF